MNHCWLTGLIALLLSIASSAPRRVPTSPDDQAIARAIERGVAYLREQQSEDGHWTEPSQPEHRLGMTALAGLALMENGIAHNSPAIKRARAVVVELAADSDQTYDLALAILFLARCQQGRRGEADPLIQALGRKLARGDHEGIWTYTVPATGQEPVPSPSKGRRGAAPQRRAAESVLRGSGRQLEYAVCASGPVGGGEARI